MQKTIDRAPNEGRAATATAASSAPISPRVDVYESDAEFLLTVDLPGVAKENVDVRVHDGELLIEAKRVFAPAGTALAEEWRARDYRRTFAVPEGIDVEKVEAKLDDGVLRLSLPKAAQKRARKIAINAS